MSNAKRQMSSVKRQMSSVKRQTSNGNGFSLIELMVVIAIMTIVMGISAPRVIRTLQRGRLRSEANHLVSTLRYSQGMAAIQRATYRIHFDLDKQTYHVTRDAGRGDDFELTEEDLMASGESSLFPGQTARYMPGSREDRYSEDEWDEESGTTNRNTAGRVEIFDEESHTLATGIKIARIIDGRGDDFTEGQFDIPMDPKGRALDAAIYLTSGREGDPVYIVEVGANGLAKIIVEDGD